jgi:hypothetical protein
MPHRTEIVADRCPSPESVLRHHLWEGRKRTEAEEAGKRVFTNQSCLIA